MKRKSLFATLVVALLLSGCGATVDLNTPKSAELKQEYSFYQNSVDKIRTEMKVTPEEADEIFIILTDCGMDNEINYVYVKSAEDNSFSVWSSGSEYVTTLSGTSVDTISLNGSVLYPAAAAVEESVQETESVLTDREVIKELKQSIEYYNNTVCTTLPLYAKKEDKEKVIELLTEAIATLDTDVDKYLQYMDNDSLSEDVRQACQYLKTGFYGVSETALKPTLEIMNGNTEIEAPDYGNIVIDAQTMYVDEAEKLID